MQKNPTRELVKRVVSIDILWFVFKPFAHLFEAMKNLRNQVEVERRGIVPNNSSALKDEEARKFAETKALFSDLAVKNGPFKGMKFPDFSDRGSGNFPKLFGSYERQLHDLLEEIFKNNYSEIINVGCEYGYYAIGCALRMPNATIYAYDTLVSCQEECKKNAAINNVDDRVIVAATCTAKTLQEFKFKTKGLVISDCEGYEKQLFTKENMSNLTNCDVLVEVHDFDDKLTGEYLRNVFAQTHDIRTFDSLSDHVKVGRYIYPELNHLNYDQKLYLLEEGRGATMEWYFFSPKKAI